MFDAVSRLADRLCPDDQDTDSELLGRFVAVGDAAAFAALVQRHGGMVFGVCRRLTRSHHDAEDAFQAAFLVLAARADTVRPPERLGAWLHGVAVNVALKARQRLVGRAVPDTESTCVGHSPTYEADDLATLHIELARLPDQYRLPLVLCHLEGRSRRDAASALGWPEGTLSGRLARGLKLLGDRLRRQGVGVPAIFGLSVAVPAELLAATTDRAVLVAAGLSGMPVHLAPLTAGVLPMLPIRRVAVFAIAGLLLGGVGVYALPASDPPPPPVARPIAQPAPRWVEVAKLTRPAPVERIAFGKNGVAVAERDGALVYWKADFRGEVAAVLKGGAKQGETRSVDRLAFTPDGRWLYGVANGGTSVWRFNGADLTGGHGIGGDIGHFHDISPDGLTWIDLYDYRPKEVHLRPNGWERTPPERRELVGVEFDVEVKRAVMSPDGNWLAVALANGTVQMVERDGMKKGTVLPVTGDAATGLVFSPDSARLAVVEPGGAVVLFAHGTGVKLATIVGHEGGTAALAFHPDGNVMATAGDDKSVRLWDAATGKAMHTLSGHTDTVSGVAFSPDGKRLASGSSDRTVRVWEFRP